MKFVATVALFLTVGALSLTVGALLVFGTVIFALVCSFPCSCSGSWVSSTGSRTARCISTTRRSIHGCGEMAREWWTLLTVPIATFIFRSISRSLTRGRRPTSARRDGKEWTWQPTTHSRASC
jgi:hypothetical protein